ncbi:hypothetical protein GH714_012460 [Hevea brasiliensis]|uniref:Uncharacterized protein n=1 Tax=Hevea brasiliensis TaxID=3981 RepID=A0A6A6LSG1_HEVBR|nr:hypothetical protein GH714_012460 [Hevea brasiliensis]
MDDDDSNSISRVFHEVLNAISSREFKSLAHDIIRSKDPDFKDIPTQIANDERYMPFFKQDCIGCIDGTHVATCIPELDHLPYRGSKGYLSFNVMATCDFDMCFAFVSSRSEGSTHNTRVFLRAIETSEMKFSKPPKGGLPNLPPGHMSSLLASFPSTPDASIGSTPGLYPSNRIMIRVVGRKIKWRLWWLWWLLLLLMLLQIHRMTIHISINVNHLYLDIVDGEKKRRVYGLGSYASTLYPDSFSSFATSRRTAIMTDHVADERIRVLEEEIMHMRENQERILQQSVEEVSCLRQQSEEQFRSMQEEMRRMMRANGVIILPFK